MAEKWLSYSIYLEEKNYNAAFILPVHEALQDTYWANGKNELIMIRSINVNFFTFRAAISLTL